MHWRKVRKTNRKFTTHERSVSVWKWMNDPNSVAAPRKLNPKFDGCFPFYSALLLLPSLSSSSPATTLQNHPAVEKEASRAIFTPVTLFKTCTNRQACANTRAHTNTKAQQTMQQECITPGSPLFIRQTYPGRSVQQLHNAITLGGEVSQE